MRLASKPRTLKEEKADDMRIHGIRSLIPPYVTHSISELKELHWE
jgi:hypothetical protein